MDHARGHWHARMAGTWTAGFTKHGCVVEDAVLLSAPRRDRKSLEESRQGTVLGRVLARFGLW